MLQPGLGAFPASTQFDAAYLMDVSFGLFSDAENCRALANIAGVLRPGGRLLLDLFNPWSVEHRFIDVEARLVEDLPAQRIRIYSYPELDTMLKAAGCRIAAVYGESLGWPARAYDPHAFGLVLLAARD